MALRVAKHLDPKPDIEELLVSNRLEIGALIALLDRKGVLNKSEVLAEINSLSLQLAQRASELPDQEEP